MKKNNLYLLLITFLMASCGIEIPLENEQYFKQVYLVRASTEESLNKEVTYTSTANEVVVSVAAGGSLNVDTDVTVTFTEDEEAIINFNGKFKASNEIQYQPLPKSSYTYPSSTATIKAGDVYGTYSIIIDPTELHCDSLYLLPLQLASTTPYQLTKENTTLLVEISLVNDYSGQYYMDGIRTTVNNGSEITYTLYRTLTAVDKNTVRLFHQVTENATNIQNNTFTITINSDNSLTMATWDQFNLIDGGGTYNSSAKSFDLWYEFMEGDITYRVEGLLYLSSEEEEEEE